MVKVKLFISLLLLIFELIEINLSIFTFQQVNKLLKTEMHRMPAQARRQMLNWA